MRRPPSRTQGILPVVRQLNNVRRQIGNRASNCFWLMKPASPADVWFCSARMPLSRTPALAGGVTLKKSFCSPFIHRRLCAKQRPGGCVTHAGFQKRLTRCRNGKCPRQSVQSHPRSRQIGSHLIRDGLAFARLQPTGFGRGTPYSSSKRGFCVRETVAVNPQSVRPNGRADVRSHGQSVSDPGPCPVRNRACPRPVRDRIRVRKLSVGSPCP